MKKLFALILTLAMALPGMGALAQEAAADPSGPAVVAVSTQMSGYLFTDMWGSNSVDVGLRSLLHGYGVVVEEYTGQYGVNSTVVTDFATSDDDRGDRTYIFTLAPDLTYNDGTPITAADYVFSVLLQSNPAIRELGGQNTTFSALKGYREYAGGDTDVFSGVRLLEENQFSVTVPASELPYYYELAYARVEPYPIDVIAPGFTVRDDGLGAYLSQEAAQNGQGVSLTSGLLRQTLTGEMGYLHQPKVTSGPYRLVEYNAASRTATLALNPHYKGNAEGRKPEVESIKIVPMNNDKALEAFAKGQVQMIHNVSDPGAAVLANQLLADGKANVSSHLNSGYASLSFASEQAPTDDVNVRKAIAMLVNRNSLISALYQDNALPVYGYYGYGQWMPQQNPDALMEYDLGYDVDSARALLEQAGYVYNKEGKPFEEGKDEIRHKLAGGVLTPLELRWAKTKSAAADLLQEQLENSFDRLGVKLAVYEMSFSDMLEEYYRTNGSRKNNLFFLSEMFSYEFDPYKSYHVGEEWQGAFNTSGLRDDELMEAAQAMRRVESGNTAAYLEKWYAFQDRWHEVMPTVPIYCTVEVDVSASTIYGFVENGGNGLGAAVLYASYTKPEVQPAQSDEVGVAN
ncbi:MAG: ABC transporter substrate-binding protein [Candidatus Limiplasma sp.]|nr:ABC transporter substrate-binding protein [Candidatus Limiplasma sp.]